MSYHLSYAILALCALVGLAAMVMGAFTGPRPGPRPPTYDDPPMVPRGHRFDPQPRPDPPYDHEAEDG